MGELIVKTLCDNFGSILSVVAIVAVFWIARYYDSL